MDKFLWTPDHVAISGPEWGISTWWLGRGITVRHAKSEVCLKQLEFAQTVLGF